MFAIVLGSNWLPSTSSSMTAQHINIGGGGGEEEEEAGGGKSGVSLLLLQAKAYTEQQQAEKAVLYCFRPAGKLGNQTARKATAQADRQRETGEERGVTATAARLTGRRKGKKIERDGRHPWKQH
ncbi:hypothetical protein Q5P01_025076 [Channa striata]|uniref:Uncharacterized protein n=1 Tax=Channa striata TaxID=64152 RepID=A0AA88LH10_CHASR|nr:hypothetical protein Q5P01_025076 [Channa striata]